MPPRGPGPATMKPCPTSCAGAVWLSPAKLAASRLMTIELPRVFIMMLRCFTVFLVVVVYDHAARWLARDEGATGMGQRRSACDEAEDCRDRAKGPGPLALRQNYLRPREVHIERAVEGLNSYARASRWIDPAVRDAQSFRRIRR